jgi:hypothetical protein
MIQMRAIKPGKPFQSSVFREEALAAAKTAKAGMLADFKKTVATWNDKPTFSSKVDQGAAVGGVRIQIGTDDPVYGFVDEGTKPHIIRPKHGKILAFKGGKYRAKTKPRVIGSTSGGATGKAVFAQVVHHPGTKKREFTKTIANKWKVDFQKEIKNALARAARRSGHGA